MKKLLKYNFISIVCISIIVLLLIKFNLLSNFTNYILFLSDDIYFKDLLSIGITILSIMIGAVITASTVLMSMCNTRLLKLINKYGKSNYIIKSIKEAIITGIISVCLYAIIYSNLDFSILILRLSILYVAGILLIIFIEKSKLLIGIVINLINDSFTENDSIIIDAEFKNPNYKKNKDEVSPPK